MGVLVAEVAAAAHDGVQGPEQLRVDGVLADVAVGPLGHDLLDVLLLAVHGEDQDFDGQAAPFDFLQAVEAAHDRHGQIEQDDVDRRRF